VTLADQDPALVQMRKRRFLDALRAGIAPSLPRGPLGLAVSGGGDSVAMLVGLAAIATEYGWELSVATVDHGLRPEAADEARFVATLCDRLGLPHRTLHWSPGRAVTGNLMDAARRARYGLLADWAQPIGRVAVAHTADDQAETFLMGLSRAAGLDGLAGLRPEWEQAGVRFIRPFLGMTRSVLRGFLVDSGVQWVDDPTNENPIFGRTQARQALAGLGAMGITPAGLARVTRNLAAVQTDLRLIVADAASRVVTETAGALEFDAQGFAALPDEIARRLLRSAVMWLSAAPYPPREASLARLVQAMRDRGNATLWGCRLVQRSEHAVLVRESRAVGQTVALGEIWDGRWRVDGPVRPAIRIGSVGAAGLLQIADWRKSGIPRDIALVTPGVWEESTLVAAPILGFGTDYAATLTAGFGLFLLSH
jgi:tRNA(Ile)-lysidine synthase